MRTIFEGVAQLAEVDALLRTSVFVRARDCLLTYLNRLDRTSFAINRNGTVADASLDRAFDAIVLVCEAYIVEPIMKDFAKV